MDNSSPPTVLITGIGSTTALSVLKGLRRQQEQPVRIVGVDINQRTEIAGSSFCDRFYTVPRADNPTYIETILTICQTERIVALFPINDVEVAAVAEHMERFRSIGVLPWVSSAQTVAICNDKLETYRFCRGHGFSAPESWTPDDLADTNYTQLPFPLIVKPRRGVGSVGVQVVHSANELAAALKTMHLPIIQRCVNGPEYTVDVLADADGNMLASVPRERIEVKAGISYKGRTVDEPRLAHQALKIATALATRGPCNIQFRIERGELFLIEINPRFSGTLPLTIAAGVNSPLLLLRLTLGERVTGPLSYRAGLYMARYWEEIFYHVDS